MGIMETDMAKIREVIMEHRSAMAAVEKQGLWSAFHETDCALALWVKEALEHEQQATREASAKTQDWSKASMADKEAYLLHDTCRSELEHAAAELEQDLKTLKSRLNPTAADYHAHPWNVDVDVYIYDKSDATEASDISDAEVDAYVEAIKKCLRGEFAIETGSPGDRGFGFWADDADWDTLNQLLGGLESRGCIVEYPDWDYIHETGNEEEN